MRRIMVLCQRCETRIILNNDTLYRLVDCPKCGHIIWSGIFGERYAEEVYAKTFAEQLKPTWIFSHFNTSKEGSGRR